MSMNSPAPRDYTKLATQQAQQGAEMNRPDQQNAYGSTVGWNQGPDGSWQQSQSFGGPLAGINQSLMGQAQNALTNPFDMGQFGKLGTGDDARNQAIDSAYTQAAARLNPQWQQRESAQRTQLLNQGLDPGSEAYRSAMSELGNQRNDAYTSAMASAIGQGTAAGDSVFRNNLMQRQNSVGEALRSRQMPMQEMQQLSGFLAQPGFQAAQGPQLLSAGMAQDTAAQQRWQQQQQQMMDYINGGMQLAGTVAPLFMSDERAKLSIRRLEEEALPGVPYATWFYREGLGPPGLQFGVIAQDLEKVAPQYVHVGADGFKRVDYSFLEVKPWTI